MQNLQRELREKSTQLNKALKTSQDLERNERDASRLDQENKALLVQVQTLEEVFCCFAFSFSFRFSISAHPHVMHGSIRSGVSQGRARMCREESLAAGSLVAMIFLYSPPPLSLCV